MENLVDEMFGKLGVGVWVVREENYRRALRELLSKGYVRLSELLGYMGFEEASSALYFIAKKFFPNIGIAVSRLGEDEEDDDWEVVLFINLEKAGKTLCEEILSTGELGILEEASKRLRESPSLKPQYREKASNIIGELLKICRETLRGEARREEPGPH